MKKMTLIVTGFLLLTIVIAVSCSKSNEEDLAPPATSGCNTVNMTYSADVVPILQANCYSCHGDGGKDGGVNLDTYENVKDEADGGALLGTITHSSGFPPMPENGGKLSDCDINIIRDWINHGALNN